MIVACPNCNSSYDAPDDASGAAQLRCPRCGIIVRQPGHGGSAPAPVPFEESTAPARTLSDPIGREWDARVTGPLSTVPSPAVDPLADLLPPPAVPVPESELAELRPAITQPRDPFYEANPLVVEQPPADAPQRAPRMGYASSPAMAAFARVPGSAAPRAPADPFAAIALQVEDSAQPGASRPPAPDAAGAVQPTYPGESSDPFANISLVAPASAPVAGGDEGSLAVMASPTLPAPAPAAPPAATVRPVRPSAEPAPRPSVAPRAASAERAAAPAEPFPPPPQLPVDAPTPSRPSVLSWLGLGLAVGVLLLAGTFAAWQYEALPLDPALSIAVARLTGSTSPLLPPANDPATIANEALAQAKAAQQRGALATASMHYRRVLALRPDDAEAREALLLCSRELGVAGAGRSPDTRPAP